MSIAFFAGGFLFDLLTLGRIDDLFNLVQQAAYLLILGTLLVFEIKLTLKTITLSERGKKFWEYHNLIVHFLFGSLLSVYTIFYYSSASALTSFLFILLLAGLMLANEIPRIQNIGLPVRVILFTICVLSYFCFFYPILMGHVGALPFWLGILSSLGFLTFVWKTHFKGHPDDEEVAKKNVLRPALLVHALFLVGYYTSLIPPVPVAIKKIGVYYRVEKTNQAYIGKHLRGKWNFWSKGSQNFLARPGDKVHILLSIFSPARFQDQVSLKWYRDDDKVGWVLEDSIPLKIQGGREDGYRGFGVKQFYRPGSWRVEVETSDGREVGRITLDISTDQSMELREFKDDIF